MRPIPVSLTALAACLCLTACGAEPPATSADQAAAPTASAAPGLFTAEQIDQARIAAPTSPAPAPAPPDPQAPTDGAAPATETAPDAGLIRVQILLDRTPFSPGIIDGLSGENTRQAVAAYREANDLGEGDAIDAALLDHLAAADAGAAMTTHTLTEADIAGPFSPPPGDDLQALVANGVEYTSALERMAERFHISESLLQALNPGVDFRRAGQRILVPAVGARPLGEVARIVVDKTERSLKAFDAEGTLLAFYPATIGSTERPAPSGTLRVLGVAPEPDYTYDPSKLSYDRGDEKVVVPAGPNNPVGSVWIDLSRESYGIHGTPDPTRIAKTASNGCVRLTNWDAEQLAAAVKPGVEVRFV